ncbi:MAG: TonB-dependent receptor, partial [Gemmatimonadaceae bacterium]
MGSVIGDITDAATGRPVAAAAVQLRGTVRRTTSDLNGRFTLSAVPRGRYTLDVRRLGYTPLSQEGVIIDDTSAVRIHLLLTPSPFRLAEVTVVPGAFSFLDGASATRQTITREQIQSAPFGEDLFRAMNRVPGLASGDYGAHFSIRGGRQDETLILLDGLEIYEPFHLKDFNEGALSIIDVETIDGVDLLTGGFPAKYGDKRSGVMNITSRTPKNDGTHLTLGASLTNANALAEGSFADHRGSWLLSGRSGFVDLLLGLLNKKET